LIVTIFTKRASAYTKKWGGCGMLRKPCNGLSKEVVHTHRRLYSWLCLNKQLFSTTGVIQ